MTRAHSPTTKRDCKPLPPPTHLNGQMAAVLLLVCARFRCRRRKIEMSNDKPKQPPTKNPTPSTTPMPAAKGPPPAKLAPVPAAPAPLFRRIDWLTFLITFAAVWIGYYLTLAPELTLEDSGELATGSFYAGIPHPPGYPVWTIYTWFWTVLLPFKNVAWRVALGEATGA